MPNSSRRKQAKPQHLHNKEDEDQDGTGNHNVTSTQSPGDQPSQESQHGSTVTGKDTNGSKVTGETDTFSENSGDDEIIVERNGENETGSEKTYLRINLKDSTYNNDSLDAIDFEDRGASAPMFTPPSPQVANRFCVYCNVVKKSPADLERHLRKHTGDRPFGCRGCEKSFKSKRSLQYHQYMNHGIEDADSNIAQRYGILRKRRLEETQLRSDYTHYLQEPVNFLNEKGATNPLNYSMQPTHQSPVAIPQDMVSKKMRLDNFPTSQPQYISAINSSLDTNSVDLSIARAAEPGLQSGPIESMDGSQDLSRACPVCTKVFPKPSDLKRHMMCHTGEKPFKCEFCGKPFRAKSSMHYHLKAAHGLDIELSPGLEERYLRMKTRAHMNSLHRSQYSGLGIQQSSDTASEVSYYRDVDELEDEIRSNDSTDMKNPGYMHDFRQGTSSSNIINEKTSRIDRATFPGQPGSYEGVVIAAAEPFRRNQISVQNETVLVTRLDGLDMINGKTASIYKCYLCGKMFNSLSGIQCHLSLHFDKQLVSFECCFCDEIFSLKTQMRNHIRKKHSSHLRRKVGKDDSSIFDDKGNKSSVFSKSLAAKLEESNRKSKKHITCKYCRKIFLNSKSLQKHMKYHFWNRNCFCRMCGKTFTQYKSLQLHISRFHWTVASNASISSHNLHQRLNFFKTFSHPANKNGMIKGKVEIKKQTDVDQIKDVTVVLPQSPSDNDELSDDVTSHHSSDNWPEHSTENGSHLIDNQSSIKVAPKRSLMSYRRENMNGKPQNKSPRKMNNDMNDYPVNFVKTEPGSQDTNNNESSHESRSGLSPDYKPNISSPDSMLPSPYMNATNHLLLAKALVAHNVSQLSQNTMNTSTPYFPPTTLPPNLAAMSHMMSLPMSVQDPNGPQTSKSPSPASLSSSKSDQSPEDREKEKELLVGYPRVQWGQKGSADKLWNFNMFQPDGNLSSDGRKVTSLSRTHSRLPIVHSPINREAMCKPTTTPDGRTLYKCPFCSKDFLSFSDINRHMDFHEDIRPYKCQYCDYYARTNSQLKVHMMRHQGIREFCCKLCNYKGVTQSDLNRHMKSQIHMLKSRNACQHCGEGFVTSKNLEKHLDGNCIVKMQKLNGDLNLPLQESIA